MTLNDLLEKRAAKLARMRALQTSAETRGADLTEGEAAEFSQCENEVRALNTQIERAQRLNEMERCAAATPLNGEQRSDFDQACSQYSLLRAIAGIAQIPGVDYGRELEVSQEIARREGRAAQGIFAPQSILRIPRPGSHETRVVVSSTTGAGLIPTDHRDDMLVDALRAASIVNNLGATVLSGLTGNVSIPALDTGATGVWVAENASITPADLDINSRTLAPRHIGAITEFSRNMILQSSPDVENLARRDFAAALASGLDSAALVGGGSNEPAGVVTRLTDASRVGTWATPTWQQGLELIEDVEIANAALGALGWALHPSVKKKLQSTVRVASTDSRFIMESNTELYGYRAASSAHAAMLGSPSGGTAIFGDWTSLVVGYWGGVDVLSNPFESGAFAKGNVQVRGLLSADVQLRHVESFAFANDMATAP
ncbi:MAG: phage major capsid protein [Hyphomonadaceae bacterium]